VIASYQAPPPLLGPLLATRGLPGEPTSKMVLQAWRTARSSLTLVTSSSLGDTRISFPLAAGEGATSPDGGAAALPPAAPLPATVASRMT
jgi:hypothetical protein